MSADGGEANSGRRRRRRRGRRTSGPKTGHTETTPTDATPGTAATPARSAQRRPRGVRHGPDRLRTVHETSAGGLVVDGIDGPREEQVAALIGRVDRRGRMLWSLPKGHIEVGETAEQTAIREVAEETGVQGDVLAALGSIDYWFVTEGRRVHKTVHHYLMRFSSGELCDDDVEVTEVAWVPIRELPSRLAYADERRLALVADELIDRLQADGPAALPPLPVTAPWRRPQTHSRTRRTRTGGQSPDRKNGRGLDP
ncbi:NUDIX hydrolase [[Mycobacterium] kokjensenii]|uniref:NUDIX hydrolase n=1 Tax=[Mycobacterium] kokjensenii TaxID=3064287 RepID=UPI002803767D|nr:NUDIX hydrolase [Mycolicibacter sp. MU0083]